MTVKKINIVRLEEYVENAFYNDYELLNYYDRDAKVKTISQAVESVIKKIETQYPDADIYGVDIKGEKQGYFVCGNNLLISFGMNKNCRDRETLADFWNEIKRNLGETFQACLYSYNLRAINFLKKCGMKILFDEITILTN